MRVLIIKLTSMGDLMHAFPALTDASEIVPNVQFDWVVDEGFAAVPQWHSNVNRVIETAHRRWRKKPLKYILNGEWRDFYRNLNASDYDVIIDMQGNLKSAFISLLRKGPVSGQDRKSCREWPAYLAYKNTFAIDLKQHAIQRQRELFARVLDYELPENEADYGVNLAGYKKPDIYLPENYLVFVHIASWTTKLWPVDLWRRLIELAAKDGYSVLLPCGNDEEKFRAESIAAGFSSAIALPKLTLDETAAIMSEARGAVCSDTGLAHLAAVAKTPSVTLYGATDTQLIGTFGYAQEHIVTSMDCSPCYSRQCSHKSSVNNEAYCMRQFSPEDVWQKLTALLLPG